MYLSVWLTSLRMIISRSIHVVLMALFFLFYDWVILLLCVILHFLWLSYTPYMLHIIFVHSSVGGYLGCFHVSTTVNNAAVNIEVHVYFWVAIFSTYMPRSGVTGSYGSSDFFFLLTERSKQERKNWLITFPKILASVFYYFSLYFLLVSQSCPTLCDPIDSSLPGSSVHGIL